jgi:hypothetical protein
MCLAAPASLSSGVEERKPGHADGEDEEHGGSIRPNDRRVQLFGHTVTPLPPRDLDPHISHRFLSFRRRFDKVVVAHLPFEPMWLFASMAQRSLPEPIVPTNSGMVSMRLIAVRAGVSKPGMLRCGVSAPAAPRPLNQPPLPCPASSVRHRPGRVSLFHSEAARLCPAAGSAITEHVGGVGG